MFVKSETGFRKARKSVQASKANEIQQNLSECLHEERSRTEEKNEEEETESQRKSSLLKYTSKQASEKKSKKRSSSKTKDGHDSLKERSEYSSNLMGALAEQTRQELL
eukprot:gb/GECG01016057.1/.p1 GENE.gb/GECG01016057.1/~~gb/GECG01016057.1/.p1  ORF type:complete len:108 (+),score=25.53 gb/GECG01016057.1/:1-324(+)